jgi:hypothetical protein
VEGERGGRVSRPLVAILVAAGTCAVVPAAGGAAPGLSMAFGTGAFTAGGSAAHVTAAATQTPRRVGGFYRVRWATGSETVRVKCVRVEGTRALLGGVVVRTTVPANQGIEVSLAIDDRGRSKTLRDRISFGQGPGSASCPVSPTAIAGPWTELERGNFTVRTLGR